MSTTTTQRAGIRLTQVLLACGIAYVVLYVVVNDVVAAHFYPGYDPVSQAISELSATGSPAMAFLAAFSPVWTVLWTVDRVRDRRPASRRRTTCTADYGRSAHRPRIVAVLWLVFPMTSRADIVPGTTAVNDIGHLVMTGLTLIFVLAEIGFSAAAFGWPFRLYAVISCAAVVVFGALTGVQASKVAAGEATPWLGLLERLSIGAWLLWMAVLAVMLMTGARRRRGASGAGPARQCRA
jgi:hypothetical protein